MADTAKKYSSRKTTPWDNVEERTPTQEFIKSNYVGAWEQKHTKLSETNESELINSVIPTKCPFCKSEIFVRKGLTSQGIQRYLCKQCSRRFIPTTGTIFDEHKISIREWIDYTLNILRYVSITADSWNNKNDFKTSRYWLQKVFLVLEDYPSTIKLSGQVWFDETFYSLRTEDIERKEDGTKPRGLSKNKMCIGVACDKKHIICFYEGEGKPNQKRTYELFKDCIERGSVLIHDEEQAHKKLVSELDLVSQTYNSKSLKGLPDKENPLNRVNEVHARLKNFLNSHSGFMREELQNYLNLFSLAMNPPSDKLAKVEILLDLAFRNPKLLRYRDFYIANSKVLDDF
ncbi:MAG: IS1595 family transposase [Clostridia bacterium]|nr:IS1595 family transposase [Clostridia bacterium]